jgi:hypothetical protein
MEGMVGQLFDDGGKLLQGLTITLGSCSQLLVGQCDHVLVAELVLSCPSGLVMCHSFGDFM